ncbi:MAG TPA: ribosomal protein S18-alanine N-acetyltransferase [Syntrophorhabdaceae bacterium]|nr:ribosomal protein S18-alanine N-acetyltransferase [Syntrophorhabdaceae bacterium]
MKKVVAPDTNREPSVVIRPMVKGDLDQLMPIEQLSFPAPWTRGMFLEILSEGLGALVLEDEGIPAAYAIFYTAATEGHLMNIAVNPRLRRKRLATKLLSRTFELLAEKGITECYLEVREGNLGAQQLYRNFGFEVIGRRKNYYVETGEDALVMRFFL